MKKINKKSVIPLYYQLMDIIIDMIDKGNLEADSKLPSERELCENYDISRSTVRQAISELEKGGYIYRLHGKGTFVSPKIFKQELLGFYSFTEEMKKIGKVPKSKVLDFKIINTNKNLASKMNLHINEKIYVFTRLRLANNEPMMVETSYVPHSKFLNLTKELLEENPLYDIFSSVYNINITSAEESFRSVLTREYEAKVLDYIYNLPSMLIERTTYSDGEVVEYTKSIARGDRFKYSILLNK